MEISQKIVKEWAFIPGEIFIDTIFENDVNKFCSTTKEYYLNNGYVILPEEEAEKQINEAIEKRYFNDVLIVDEDRYYDMLEVLPPLKYFNGGFMMLEKQIDNITKAFFKINDLYFEFFVRTSWDFETILNQLLTLLLKQYKKVCDSHDWDYEFNYIDDIKNNNGSYNHLVNVINKG